MSRIIINERPHFSKSHESNMIGLKNLDHDKDSGRKEFWSLNEKSFRDPENNYKVRYGLTEVEYQEVLDEFDKLK
jgi:hypothetical protein